MEVDVSDELRSVRQVLATQQLTEALQYVDRSRDETVQEFLGVCNAHGPSGDEIYRARHIFKLFRIYGLENVHIDDKRNVIGIRRGTGEGPKVVLNAHMDVVAQWPKEQPIEAFVADGMSLRGNVWDYGNSRFEVGGSHPLNSEVRRKTSNHDVTDSVPIDRIWAGVKHGLLFAVSRTGLDQE